MLEVDTLDTKTHDNIPRGFKLHHILRGHTRTINRISWSPDGHFLASPSNDGSIRFWDEQTGQLLRKIDGSLVFSVVWSPDGSAIALGGVEGVTIQNVQSGEKYLIPSSPTNSVAWSPSGDRLALCYYKAVQIFEVKTRQLLQSSMEHADEVTSVAWSQDGRLLASGSSDYTIKIWDIATGLCFQTLTGHSHMVHSMAWSSDGRFLASGSSDATIRLWNYRTGEPIRILEGHTNSIICISFSPNGSLLASKSHDGTVRCWRTDTWETIAILNEPFSKGWSAGLAFHPLLPKLATLGEDDCAIRIWDLDLQVLLNANSAPLSVQYTNAKVVLVGDSGVGKTGLGLVLTNQPFVPTESTHGRYVWVFNNQECKSVDKGSKETRETLLWDLAGQPGYRLIHQLHLNEVSVALVVFDARSETDPFMGVGHWVRALRQAQRIQSTSAPPMKMFLVAARIDRSGRGVSPSRINLLMEEFGFDGYFETSAKEGRNINTLIKSIQSAIDWNVLPKISSTDLFRRIKAFLISERDAKRLLSAEDDLYRAFLMSYPNIADTKDLRAQFETCIVQVESRGLIRRLSFGNLILLQPEYLDAYASALVNAAKDDSDGLGCIAEEKARMGIFTIPQDERIKDKEQEKLLLIAMVEDLLRYEVALREPSDNGLYLVFPSQTTRENPDLQDPEGATITYFFEGPVTHIYATLAVRLSNTGFFIKEDLWKNAVTYTTKMDGTYGIILGNKGEGRGELTLFFDDGASEEMRFHFEEYVDAHLQRRALPGSIYRQQIIVCSKCKTRFTEAQIRKRREISLISIRCSVCESTTSLLDIDKRLTEAHKTLVQDMNIAANIERDRVASAFVKDSLSSTSFASEGHAFDFATPLLKSKIKIGDYDIFLCHNTEDKPQVKKLGKYLMDKFGILPWLDEWELRPGLRWQHLLEQQIGQIRSAAVFVGKDGIGPWQHMELEAFLSEFVRRGCPIIPILLPDAPIKPQLPIFLRGLTWIDFRKQDPDPMKQLIWGITGMRGSI
jgi:WD40 repeat protein